MKLKTAVILLAVGVSSSTAAGLTLPLHRGGEEISTTSIEGEKPIANEANGAGGSRFTAGQTLTVDARLGHASLSPKSAGETFLFASVAGSDEKAAASPPVNLAIVVDRSGSMKGIRIANALAAARGAVERLREGDTVTVVAFDTRADVIVSNARVSDSTRAGIEREISQIRLGGDTCISCGLETAARTLQLSGNASNVNRIVLLSDGATNSGITDVPGLRGMAGRMRDRGLTISTIGVDVDFDEKVMSALAQEGNGRHYFVQDATKLPEIFAEEFDSVLASVASNAEMVVDLAPGVDVSEVFDRSFRREGNKVIIPFGAFSSKQEKTALLKLRVPTNALGDEKIASVHLTYRDLGKATDASCDGELSLLVTDDDRAQKELDPFVSARLERTRTAQTLTEANQLFASGHINEARQHLARRKSELADDEVKTVAIARATNAAPPTHAKPVARDFEDQQAFVADADKKFSQPSPVVAAGPQAPAQSTVFGKGAIKTNQAAATDLAR